MAIHPLPLVLASASKSREALLKLSNVEFACINSGVDEKSIRHTVPQELVKQIAYTKCEAVEKIIEKPSLIVAADTVVVWRNEIFEKPRFKLDAVEMLKKLQGDIHTVITGWCVYNSYKQVWHQGFSETYVTFRPLTYQEMVHYADDHPVTEWAGGYNSQLSEAITFIQKMEGSLTGLNGLPLEQVIPVLKNEWAHPYKKRE